MAENFNYCHVVGKTDVGRKRAANEDNMYNLITQNGLVSIVCDGMGGHVGGATASKIAVSTIAEHLTEVYYDDPRIAIGESIDKANKAILQKTAEQPELNGMGSTCVLLLVRDGKVYIGHVGDSRIYLVRSKRIIQLTKDHSYVQMLVDCGEITKEQAEHHPRKNEITNALGIPNMTPATVAEDAIIPEAGDCFVLCSDGLSGMVSDQNICKVIGRQAEMTAQERVDRLVDMANENGGVDNITIQLVEFSVTPGAAVTEKKLPLWAKIACAVPVLVGLAIGAVYLINHQKDAKGNDSDESVEDVLHGGNVVEDVTILPGDPVVFKKNATIVEFEFTDSTLRQNRPGYDPYDVTNVQIDPSSLHVESDGVASIKTQRKSYLVFTDEAPSNSKVVYTFSSPDKTKLYKYVINVKVSGDAPSFDISGIKPAGRDGGAEDGAGEGMEDATPVADAPAETVVNVRFEYTELKGAKLILNYSANPSVKLFKSEEKLGTARIGEVLLDDNKFDYPEADWKQSSNRTQLIFEFRDVTPAASYNFIIPCLEKGSDKRILVCVELVKLVEEVVEEVVLDEKNGSEEDNTGEGENSAAEDTSVDEKSEGATEDPEGLEVDHVEEEVVVDPDAERRTA